ncbi:HEPN domain-containing protein [Roseateles microcysteis]|uniref:HEPN domain-containing protein n=1 Tax=Roseateles microcysteis TaxID=3119057 RepID=UPI002FE62F2E
MSESAFTRRKSTATYWRNKSNDLLGAAGLVWLGMGSTDGRERDALGLPDWYSFEVACPAVFRMLCGMSTELLLKAIIVQRGNEPKQTHNLIELSKQAALDVSAEQSQLLSVLTEYVIWDGRYPVPKTEPIFEKTRVLAQQTLTTKVRLGNSSFSVLRQNGALDWDNFLKLWNRFNEVYLAHDA